MRKKFRSQSESDADREYYSGLAATHFDPDDPDSRDMARQEFKAEADINVILRRFGVTGQIPSSRPLVFGEANYDLDLQRAMMALETAEQAHANLPPELKERYPTWQSLINAADDGTLELEIKKPEPVTTPPVTTPPTN